MLQKLIFLVFFAFVAAATHLKDVPSQRGPNPPLLTPIGCGSLHCHILSQLPAVVGCCVVPEDRDRALSGFADLLVEECGSELDSLDSCVAEVTLKELDNACLCVTPNELSESLKTKMRNSVIPAMVQEQLHPSKQAYPNSPGRKAHNVGMVTQNSEIRCTDSRQHGPLCSLWEERTLTAGNTRCRANTKCESHGYGYEWCYTDFSNNWEYCCTGACDFHNEAYRWCRSINKWEYCGEYDTGKGLKHVTGVTCRIDHMCGKHAHWYDTYWCEYDTNGNWDYCCAPGEACYNNDCYANDMATYKRYCTNH